MFLLPRIDKDKVIFSIVSYSGLKSSGPQCAPSSLSAKSPEPSGCTEKSNVARGFFQTLEKTRMSRGLVWSGMADWGVGTVTERSTDRSSNRSIYRSSDRMTDRSTDGSTDRLPDGSTDWWKDPSTEIGRAIHRPIRQPIGRRPVDRSFDRSVGRSLDRSLDRSTDRAVDQSTDSYWVKNIHSPHNGLRPPSVQRDDTHVHLHSKENF